MTLSVNGQVNRAAQVARMMAMQEKFRAQAGEKLSSGLKINRASDDAAGLTISETITAKIRGELQAGRNVLDGISLLNVAEGGMSSIADILQRMRELAVQSAHGTYTDTDRAAIQAEFGALKAQINLIAENCEYNGLNLLRGTDPVAWTTTSVPAVFAAGAGTTNTFNAAASVGPSALGAASVGLPGGAEVYAGSIYVEAYDTVLGTTRTIAMDPTNGFSYAAGAITFNGTGTLNADEYVRVRYVRAGALTMNLSGTPEPGSEQVRVNGALVPSTDYTVAGNTITLTGSRPVMTSLASAANLSASYMTGQLQETYSLGDFAVPNYEGGNVTPTSVYLRNTATGAITPVAADPVNGYSLTSVIMGYVGDTPLYNYEVQLNGTSRDAVGSGPHAFHFTYDLEYPTADPVEIDIQSGAMQGQVTTISIDRSTVGGLGLVNARVASQTDAQAAIGLLDDAVASLSRNRGRVGASVNRLEFIYNNVNSSAEAHMRARSYIRDTDMAATATEAVKRGIQFQSGASVFREASRSAQYLLRLLGA